MRAGKADCLFVESPPLSAVGAWFFYSRLRNVPSSSTSQTCGLDAVRDTLTSQEGVALKCARALELWSYRKADYVCAVTEGILSELQK